MSLEFQYRVLEHLLQKQGIESAIDYEERLLCDYKDYFANKYKMDRGFYDDFIAMGGKLPEGMEVVEKIGKVKTNYSDRPLEDVVIVEATLL